MTELDTDDIVGVAETGAPFVVPVRVAEVETPVRVRLLPSYTASIRSVTVTQDGVQLLPRDPRRRRALITGTDSVQLGTTQAGAAQAGAFNVALGPSVPLFEYTAVSEVWAAVEYGTPPVVVSILTELWAD